MEDQARSKTPKKANLEKKGRKKKKVSQSVDVAEYKAKMKNQSKFEHITPGHWRDDREPKEQEAINYLIDLSEHGGGQQEQSHRNSGRGQQKQLPKVIQRNTINGDFGKGVGNYNPPIIGSTDFNQLLKSKHTSINTPFSVFDDVDFNFSNTKKVQQDMNNHHINNFEAITNNNSNYNHSNKQNNSSITIADGFFDNYKPKLGPLDQKTIQNFQVLQVPKLKLDESFLPSEDQTPQGSQRFSKIYKPNEKLIKNAKRLNMKAPQRSNRRSFAYHSGTNSPTSGSQNNQANLLIDLNEQKDFLKTLDPFEKTMTKFKSPFLGDEQYPHKIFSKYPQLRKEPIADAYRNLNKRNKVEGLRSLGVDSPMYQSLVNTPRSPEKNQHEKENINEQEAKQLIRRLRSVNKRDEEKFLLEINHRRKSQDSGDTRFLQNRKGNKAMTIDITNYYGHFPSDKGSSSPKKASTVKNNTIDRAPTRNRQLNKMSPQKFYLQKRFEHAWDQATPKQHILKTPSHIHNNNMQTINLSSIK